MQSGSDTTEKILGMLNEVEARGAPSMLYFSGDRALLKLPRVSLIGSRKPSAEGVKRAKSWSRELCKNGVCVVSGLALGIDSVAHRTTIETGGKTIAVIGSPLDQFSPPSNRRLQEQIAKDHLLISQFAPGTKVYPSNFPIRNRTMALCSHSTVIVEAGAKSGTEYQAWEALRLGRGLFISEELMAAPFPWIQKVTEYGAISLQDNDLSPLYDFLPTSPVLSHSLDSRPLS